MEQHIETKNQYYDYDEISLIDIFVTLLKHRWLIIAGTVSVTVIALVWFYILPFMNDNLKQKVVEMQLYVKNYPGYLADYVGSTADKLAIFYFRKQDLIQSAVVESSLYHFGNDEKDNGKINYVLNDFLDKIYTVNQDRNNKNFITLQVKVTGKKEENAKQFLNYMVTNVNKEIFEDAQKASQDILENLTSSISMINSKSTIVNDFTLRIIQQAILYTKKTNEDFIDIIVPPYVKAKSYKLAVVVSFFSSLFLFIFIAFIIEAINNAKSDEQVIQKIKQALGK